MKLKETVFFFLSLLVICSCHQQKFKKSKVMAGGKYVSAETLNKGEKIYTEYCIACHGIDGDGKGLSAKGLTTPPRNFKLGIIKFADVASGDLSHDEAIYKILDHGLNGSAMLAWDLSAGQKNAVWQYIKTFAPATWEGKDKKLGDKIVISKDPYGLAHKNRAIELGRDIYHVTANCQSCHRGYITLKELDAASRRINDEAITELDEDFYKLKPQESDHGYNPVPPDFLFHKIKSVRGTNIEDIYLRIAAGVGGTAMPAWQGTIEDDEIWAVSYYIQDLMKMKDHPKAKELIGKLGQ